MILSLCLFIQFSSAWTVDDLLKKEPTLYLQNAFSGGNILEQNLQQVQLVVERDDGKKGQEYFLKVNPRGGRELLAQKKLARVSENATQKENEIYKNQSKIQMLELVVDLFHAKKIDLLVKKTEKLLAAQKKAQEKALSSTEYGNAREYIKSSIAIKNFSIKMIEFHARKAAMNARLKQIDQSWNLENFELDESFLDKSKIVQHVKSYNQTASSLFSEINNLKIEQAEALKDITRSQNNKLIDSLSLGVDDTRQEKTFSFRISFNLPSLSSNPVQDWQAQNKIIELKRVAHESQKEQVVEMDLLRDTIIHTSEDLDLDLSAKWNSKVEKSLMRLKDSDPLSAFSLYADLMIARISLMESERSLYSSYLLWLNLTQDFSSSIFSKKMGLQ